jgi:hypothetical protein
VCLSLGTMDGSSPDDDCYGEQEREGDDNPGVSEPRMVKAFMRTQSFAMPSPGNLVRSRRLSRSLIIRAQRSNRRVRARDLVTGAATVDFMCRRSVFSIKARRAFMANAPTLSGVPDVSEPRGERARHLCPAAEEPPWRHAPRALTARPFRVPARHGALATAIWKRGRLPPITAETSIGRAVIDPGRDEEPLPGQGSFSVSNKPA